MCYIDMQTSHICGSLFYLDSEGWAPILFTLIKDDFSIKHINDDNIKHLIASFKMMYKFMEDWTGDLYCSIALNCDYINRNIDISMPGNIKKKQKEWEKLENTIIMGPYLN